MRRDRPAAAGDRAWLDAKPGRPRTVVMQRGDIWLVSLDPTAGHEQQGTRPVVIVSPAAFNDLTGTPVVLPITTGGSFARRRGFAVSLEDAGTRTSGVIRCGPAACPRPRCPAWETPRNRPGAHHG